jgi:hypothetical protein
VQFLDVQRFNSVRLPKEATVRTVALIEGGVFKINDEMAEGSGAA